VSPAPRHRSGGVWVLETHNTLLSARVLRAGLESFLGWYSATGSSYPRNLSANARGGYRVVLTSDSYVISPEKIVKHLHQLNCGELEIQCDGVNWLLNNGFYDKMN
jgi:hypothetical protein